MSKRINLDMKMSSVEDLLSASGNVMNESQVEVSIDKIHDFYDHPFRVSDDEKMQELIESIKMHGVLTPVLLRKDILDTDDFEMISGHRRLHAAKRAGLTTIPAIIRDMSDDEAVIMMVDSNIQREELLYSEKAYAYKMKMEALKRQGRRTDLTSGHNGPRLAVDIISSDTGDSSRQIKRYIRLTYLIKELLDLVDQKKLSFVVAVEISYFESKVQRWIYEYIKDAGASSVKIATIKKIRSASMPYLKKADVFEFLDDKKQSSCKVKKISFHEQKIRSYFSKDTSEKEIEEVILTLLEHWKKENESVTSEMD